MLIPLHEVASNYKIDIKGVLHVGAHKCEENDEYLSDGVAQSDIFWIEANPDLVKAIALPNVIEAAVSDKIEDVTFHITNNMQSSSILALKEHSIVHPDIVVTSTRVVRTQRLEDIIRTHSIKANFINLDIQGAELKALNGMGDFINQFECIHTEVNTRELYAGCALLTDLDDWLWWRGFKRVRIAMNEDCGWGDAVYIRTKEPFYLRVCGRTGNHLFQLGACEIMSRKTGRPFVVTFTDPWALGSVLTYEPRYGLVENFIDDCYFEDLSLFDGHEQFIKDLFAFRNPVTLVNECIVHLRLGDLARNTVSMGDAYPIALARHIPKGVPVHIMSETPAHPYATRCMEVFAQLGIKSDILPANLVDADFVRLVQAKYVLGSSFTTFVFWASYLGRLHLPEKQTVIFYSPRMQMGDRHVKMFGSSPWFCTLVSIPDTPTSNGPTYRLYNGRIQKRPA